MSHFFQGGIWVLLFHLQCFAGGSITLSGERLQPVISASLDPTQIKGLQDASFEKASVILSLHLITEGKPANLPVYGNYKLKGQNLYFTPLYPLGHNLAYEIQFHQRGRLMKKRFSTPGLPRSKAITKVLQVYPISDTIPSNTLFFHIRFSSPMMQDINAWRYVSVLDERGNKIDQTWRQHSFWLDSGRLLVLMVHPGRVKTGIHYIGPVFETGKNYILRTETGLKDASGKPVKAEITKAYFVKEEDRVLPQIVNVVAVQRDKTSVAVSITFSEGMDYASICEGIKLTDENGRIIPVKVGRITNDRSFLLTTTNPLPKGRYSIQFKSSVSDFAANRLNRPFEITSLEERLSDTVPVYRVIDIK